MNSRNDLIRQLNNYVNSLSNNTPMSVEQGVRINANNYKLCRKCSYKLRYYNIDYKRSMYLQKVVGYCYRTCKHCYYRYNPEYFEYDLYSPNIPNDCIVDYSRIIHECYGDAYYLDSVTTDIYGLTCTHTWTLRCNICERIINSYNEIVNDCCHINDAYLLFMNSMKLDLKFDNDHVNGICSLTHKPFYLIRNSQWLCSECMRTFKD
jgi:hypothetical protein